MKEERKKRVGSNKENGRGMQQREEGRERKLVLNE